MNQPKEYSNVYSNNELRVFLQGFSKGSMAPKYAVMLDGAWGAGKTWFIKDFIDKLDDETKERVLYVSLYGLTKPADIEDAFFQQLYPRLSNKKLQYGYSIFKNFLKGTLKIDLDGDGKDDGSLQISLPEVEKFSTNPERTLLIFDDLERAKMAPEELLGYINQFVEHEGRRVIIIANENKLLETNAQFRDIKEKVVGRTFEIKPEPEAALTTFIAETRTYGVETILVHRKKLVLDVFQRAGHKNLRNLRQALLDFANLWQCLPAEEMSLLAHEKFQDRLVEEVISLSVECRACTISPDDIECFEVKSPMAEGGAKATLGSEQARAVRDPFALHGLSSSRAVLLPSAYAHFYRSGHLPKELAQGGLARGAFFTDAAKPAWQQLWHRLELSNDRFDVLKNRLLKELKEEVYRKPEELLHAVGILLQLAKDGLLDQSTLEISKLATDTLTSLATKGALEVDVQSTMGEFKPNFYSGYGMPFEGRTLEEFKNFSDSLRTAWSTRNKNAMQARISQWLDELREKPQQWAVRLAANSDRSNWFSEVAIFKMIEPRSFFALLLGLDAPTLTYIISVLRQRYVSIGKDYTFLRDEVFFWESMGELIKEFLGEKSKITLSEFVVKDELEPLVEDIAYELRGYYDAFKEAEQKLLGDIG